jgi:hypothetical protein
MGGGRLGPSAAGRSWSWPGTRTPGTGLRAASARAGRWRRQRAGRCGGNGCAGRRRWRDRAGRSGCAVRTNLGLGPGGDRLARTARYQPGVTGTFGRSGGHRRGDGRSRHLRRRGRSGRRGAAGAVGRNGCGHRGIRRRCLGSAGAALRLLRFFRLVLANEPVPGRPSTDPVSLRILDARRVALDADAKREREVKGLFVCQAKLACQLVQPNLLGQGATSIPSVAVHRNSPANLYPRTFSHHLTQHGDSGCLDRSAKGSAEGPPAGREIQAGYRREVRWRRGAEPRPPSGCRAVEPKRAVCRQGNTDKLGGRGDPPATDTGSDRLVYGAAPSGPLTSAGSPVAEARGADSRSSLTPDD